ncbi:MAG: malonyl CoA-acyl carrier protein transacylase [Myxococcota bacterium]|jgi:malonyl CoA-acyl carrier protein transacylase
MNTTIAAMFPGQGSQKTGMAQDFHDTAPQARAVFEEVSEALGLDMAALCFSDDARLNLTAFTQPAILTAEIAIFRTLVAEHGLTVDVFGGHSLGEYAALVAAGVIPLVEAARLVRRRGEAMQEAVAVGDGAMLAVTGRDLDLAAIRAAADAHGVDLANLNSPEQVVLSGATEGIAAAEVALVTALPGARLTRLTVSAPFHSRLMAPIETNFRALLTASSHTWTVEGVGAVLCNFTGGFYPDGDRAALIDGLTRQISGAVRWTDNMAAVPDGATIYEVGPRRPLRGFFRALGVSVTAITNRTTARRAFT